MVGKMAAVDGQTPAKIRYTFADWGKNLKTFNFEWTRINKNREIRTKIRKFIPWKSS